MDIDAGVAKRHIGIMNFMACGARDFVRTSDGSMMFRVGSGRKLAKVIVSITPADTYTVRYVEMKRKTGEIVIDETCEGVYCDNLGAVVRKMGDR
jgi:hypothetical protein